MAEDLAVSVQAEHRMVSRVIYHPEDFTEVVSAGISKNHFHDDEHGAVWDWILEHWERHGQVPGRDALRLEYPNYKLAKVPEPLSYYIDLLNRAHERNEIHGMLLDATRLAGDEDIKGVRKLLADRLDTFHNAGTSAKALSISAETVELSEVESLFRGRLPLGKLAILDGDPGVGKSSLTAYLAAAVTGGIDWPDGSAGPRGGAVLLSAEDDPGDTIVPRLKAVGAKLSQIRLLEGGPGRDGIEPWVLCPEHLPVLRSCIEEVNALLVVIDPLMAFLDSDVNAHSDADIRRALRPLAELAQETGAAILLVRHLNKMQHNTAIYRGGGSIGIIGAARSGLLVAKHPDDEPDDPEARRVLAVFKSNLGPPAPSLSYRITEDSQYKCAKLVWDDDEVSLTADDLLSPPNRKKLDQAKEWLETFLSDGVRRPSAEVKQAARAHGFTERTIERAKEQTPQISSSGKGQNCTWRLGPEDEDELVSIKPRRLRPLRTEDASPIGRRSQGAG